jgi:hypothetical protein
MNIDILKKSMIGKDFLLLKDKGKVTIDIDECLDYRNYWENRKIKCRAKSDYSRRRYVEIFQLEIDSIDEIMKSND